MSDARLQKLAHLLVDYSLRIRPGDKLIIWAQLPGVPLVREVYRAALQAGGYPTARLAIESRPVGSLAFDGMTETLLREGNDDQFRFFELDRQEIDRYDALLAISAPENTRAMAGIPSERLTAFQQARAPVSARWHERAARGDLRWCSTVFPTNAYAQDAGMSLRDYEDFVFRAELLDRNDPVAAWQELAIELERVAAFLGRHDEIHVVAPGTDLTYRAGGRTWVASEGTCNFPDGEVFTGPIEDSANGMVTFSYPGLQSGGEVEGVRLTFRDGKVVEARADRGQKLLDSTLDLDPGARFLGEAAFGLNYGITRFTRNTLFDEKIGGTMHLAVGHSYPETGGQNDSALHWDLVCDLHEGQVYADGELCYERGRFLI